MEMEINNESTRPYRCGLFRCATRGMRAYTVALVLNSLRPGIDFRGMGKRALCDEFADGLLSKISGQQLREAIAQKLSS